MTEPETPIAGGGRSIVRIVVYSITIVACLATFGFLAVTWLFYDAMYNGFNWGDPVDRACRLARLAPIKGEIVRSENRHNIFAGSTYVIFRATRPEIEKWIADSPGMQGVTPDVFHADYRYETMEVTNNSPNLHYDKKVEYGFSQEGVWHILPATRNGVRYRIEQDHDANGGTVIIDWDTNTVWVKALHS